LSVAERIASETLARQSQERSIEVRRLLDAGLVVMRRCGTSSRPRVADIVAEAGISNDAFYRYFASKDMLATAILEDGMLRLRSYLDHQMAKEPLPAGQVRRWVEGVLSQATDAEVAATTLAVQWNAANVSAQSTSGPPSADTLLAGLLIEPFAELGSAHPELDAALAAHAVVGRLSDHLWHRSEPSEVEIAHVVAACLAIAGSAR
jgi:AcrR family transcriptional regulator